MGRKRKMRKKVFSKIEISVKIPSALKKKKKKPVDNPRASPGLTVSCHTVNPTPRGTGGIT